MESNTRALQEANNARAATELGELRADTIRGLRWAAANEGPAGVLNLLREAVVLTAVFDLFADGRRETRCRTHDLRLHCGRCEGCDDNGGPSL